MKEIMLNEDYNYLLEYDMENHRFSRLLNMNNGISYSLGDNIITNGVKEVITYIRNEKNGNNIGFNEKDGRIYFVSPEEAIKI